MPTQLRTADRYYAQSAAIARRAAREAAKKGQQAGAISAVALIIAQYQAVQAAQVPQASAAMLAEQGINALTEAALLPLAFATPLPSIEAMLLDVQRDIDAEAARLAAEVDQQAEQLWTDWRFGRLVESLVQDAGRLAQQVDATTRPRIAHVRHLNLPSCNRCAVLAGRVYRFSEGFRRHPGCDCVMIPTTLANDSLTYDIEELVRTGQVTGLSAADRRAIADGADFNQVANAKRGMRTATVYGRRVQITTEGTTARGVAGKALGNLAKAAGSRYRRSANIRLSPGEIYKQATDRADALRLLKLHGYIR